jgi:hypothetical protein
MLGVLTTLQELDQRGVESWRRPSESEESRRIKSLQSYHRRVRQFAGYAELIWNDVGNHHYMAACHTYMQACDLYPALLSLHTQLFPSTNDNTTSYDGVNISAPVQKQLI